MERCIAVGDQLQLCQQGALYCTELVVVQRYPLVTRSLSAYVRPAKFSEAANSIPFVTLDPEYRLWRACQGVIISKKKSTCSITSA